MTLQLERKSGGTQFLYGFLGHWGRYPIGCCHPMWYRQPSWVRQRLFKALAPRFGIHLQVGRTRTGTPPCRNSTSSRKRFLMRRENLGPANPLSVCLLGTRRPGHILPLSTDADRLAALCSLPAVGFVFPVGLPSRLFVNCFCIIYISALYKGIPVLSLHWDPIWKTDCVIPATCRFGWN